MSIHSEPERRRTPCVGERSVLTRFERHPEADRRTASMDRRGRLSAWGLPKVRTKFKVVTRKAAKAAKATDDKKADEAPAE